MSRKEINLIDIAKLQKWYIDVFEEEDNWYLPTKKIKYCPICGRRLESK